MLEPSPEVYDAVKGLRTVRRFRKEQVSEEHLADILEAARWTGSSKNRQSWAFVVIRDRDQLDRLAETGDFTTPVRNAPMVIAPIGLPDAYDWDMGPGCAEHHAGRSRPRRGLVPHHAPST